MRLPRTDEEIKEFDKKIVGYIINIFISMMTSLFVCYCLIN